MIIKHIILLLIFVAGIHSFLTVDPNSNNLRDQHNRIRIFHGVNSVYKEFPYHPTRDHFDSNGSLVEQDFLNLKRWGFNSVRLYIAWQGFEPTRHQYNYTYLEQLRSIVQEAQRYGISIIIDAHHDLYSKKYCGQGFPTWLGDVTSFPAPFKVNLRKDAQGLPLKEDCMKIPFTKYYLTYDVMSFSEDFFKNKHGMNDMFVEMWVKVVEFFKTEPNVIGYDILNEPAGGNFWKNPYSFIGPDQENNRFLLPFYRKISAQIRKIDQDRLLFFEPAPQDLIGGFLEPLSDLPSKDVLNYHTYCPFKKDLGSKKCDYYNRIYMKRRQENIRRLGIAGILSEFGSVGDTPEGRAEIRSVTGVADQLLISWYYWQFKYNMDSTCSTSPPWLHSFYYPNATLQAEKVQTLAYSYAYAICGRFISQRRAKGSYTLSFFPADCGEKFTQLFLNYQFEFPDGFVLEFEPECKSCSLRMLEKGYYQVMVDSGLKGRAVTVKVGAKIRAQQTNNDS